jgi:hypothetical protein
VPAQPDPLPKPPTPPGYTSPRPGTLTQHRAQHPASCTARRPCTRAPRHPTLACRLSHPPRPDCRHLRRPLRQRHSVCACPSAPYVLECPTHAALEPFSPTLTLDIRRVGVACTDPYPCPLWLGLGAPISIPYSSVVARTPSPSPHPPDPQQQHVHRSVSSPVMRNVAPPSYTPSAAPVCICTSATSRCADKKRPDGSLSPGLFGR